MFQFLLYSHHYSLEFMNLWTRLYSCNTGKNKFWECSLWGVYEIFTAWSFTLDSPFTFYNTYSLFEQSFRSEIPGRTTNRVTAVYLYYNRREQRTPEVKLNNSRLTDALTIPVCAKRSLWIWPLWVWNNLQSYEFLYCSFLVKV